MWWLITAGTSNPAVITHSTSRSQVGINRTARSKPWNERYTTRPKPSRATAKSETRAIPDAIGGSYKANATNAARNASQPSVVWAEHTYQRVRFRYANRN